MKINYPRKAIENSISMVPEDRKTQGLVLSQSIKNNITLGILDHVSKLGFIQNKKANSIAEFYAQKLSIKMKSIDDFVSSLSGGNQQKVTLSRSLAMKPKILLLDEPTRGVDVGAREEIHNLIDTAVEENLAVLVVSSDIEELLNISDRVVVLRGGNIIGEYLRTNVTKEEVIRLATA